MKRKTISRLRKLYAFDVCDEWEYLFPFFDSLEDMFDFMYKTAPELYVNCYQYTPVRNEIASDLILKYPQMPSVFIEYNLIFSMVIYANLDMREFADQLYKKYHPQFNYWLTDLGFSPFEISGYTPPNWQKNVAKDGFTHSAQFMGVD